jgi:CheY-like chemotaxis protein
MPPQQRTILIVDDDHEILESIRTILENKGFRILAARDGNAGLMLAERENPDLLVLDMMMPKKSGFLVLEKLKSRPGGLIPTIMIKCSAFATISANPSPWKNSSARLKKSSATNRAPVS